MKLQKKGWWFFINDEHPENAHTPISFTEEGIVICINDDCDDDQSVSSTRIDH